VVRPLYVELTAEQRELQSQREATEHKARQLLESIAATRLRTEEAVAARRAAEAAEAAVASQPAHSVPVALTESDEHNQLQDEPEEIVDRPTPRTLHSLQQQQRIDQLETKVRRLQVALGKASRTEDSTHSTLTGKLDEEREQLRSEVQAEKQYAPNHPATINLSAFARQYLVAPATARE
jgi:hypothetical protein